jgi:hypothetical protein
LAGNEILVGFEGDRGSTKRSELSHEVTASELRDGMKVRDLTVSRVVVRREGVEVWRSTLEGKKKYEW